MNNRRVQLITVIVAVFAGLFSMTRTVLADDDVWQGSMVSSSQTVENDVLLNGTSIALNGTVVGDALAVGRTVVINGDVQGSMLILAEDIVHNGNVDGSIYAVSVSFNSHSGSDIGRSLYYLGVSLLTENESQIGRDLNAVTLGARLAGTVGRNPKAIVGPFEIGKIILDRVNAVTTGKPVAVLLPSADPVGTVSNQKTAQNVFAAALGPVGTNSSQSQLFAQEDGQPEEEGEEVPENTAVTWIVERLRELITLLVIGGLGLWLIPKKVEKWATKVRTKPLAAGGWGLVAYIMGFIGTVTVFMLILVVGISFAFVTLWGLAWSWWAVGFSSLALAFSLFLVAVAYGSKVIVAYLIGKLILERFGPQPDMRKPWPLLLGLTIFVLLCGIPYLGWAISLVVTFLGLGAIWLVFMGRNNQDSKREQLEPA